MPGEITRWLTNAPGQRQHSQELASIGREVELVTERVNAIAATGNTIMTNTLLLTLVQQEAERIAPGSAEKFALIVNTAVMQMVQQLTRLR